MFIAQRIIFIQNLHVFSYYESVTCSDTSEALYAQAYDVCIPLDPAHFHGHSSMKYTGGCGMTGNYYVSATCTGTPVHVDNYNSTSYNTACQTSVNNDDYPNVGLIAMVAVFASGFITAVF